VSTVGLVVGNPKPRSRTLALAEAVATAAAEATGLDGIDRLTVDLAELGPQLFDWSSAPVREAVDGIRSCALVVVASPTYKASYTGLLKSFLDRFGNQGLAGKSAVPIMLGGLPSHQLAVNVHFSPLLLELGATVPAGGLFVLESEVEEFSSFAASWAQAHTPALVAALVAGAHAQQTS
jgi:FMN reductase